MAIYVYRNAASDGARELALALGGRKIRYSDQRGFYYKRTDGSRIPVRFTNRDVIVCWGEELDNRHLNGARVLNGQPIRNKYDDAIRLRQAGVSTVEVSLTEPRATPAPPPPDPAQAEFEVVKELLEDFPNQFTRNRAMQDGVIQLVQRLNELNVALGRPAPVAPPVAPADWLPRLRNHVGGNDLLDRPGRPEFWVKRLDLVREFRVHSFLGRSIRAGVKAVRDGFPNPHQWIRSWNAGWGIKYDGVSSRQEHRDLAHEACRALGLDFAAVDIGETQDGLLVVLELNRAPGLEGGTTARYSNAILRWQAGEFEEIAA